MLMQFCVTLYFELFVVSAEVQYNIYYKPLLKIAPY